MKQPLLPCLFLILFFGMGMPELHMSQASRVTDLSKRNISSCSPYSWERIERDKNGKFIGALPGWGHYSYHISTTNDSSQFYFNQGLNMYYGYHMKEALASFQESARFDSGSSMAYWGQALSMGPYYNAAYSYTMPAAVPGALQHMNRSIGNVSEKEKQLIEAMSSRYSSDLTDSNRASLNLVYALRMRHLIKLYPADPDIKALYIDAIMLIHAWDFWANDGSPKEWTPELVELCKTLLKTNPNHPGALHYYIHLTEASRHPEIAVSNAELLRKLFPGVAHLVHMASHEYERTGLYAKGVEVNDNADDDLATYHSLNRNISLTLHSSHYFAVQSYCALSGAMYKEGMRTALRCRDFVSPTYEDTYLYSLPLLTLVRLGKWEEILSDSTTLNPKWVFAGLLNDFSKGMAFVYQGNLDSAKIRLEQMQNKAKDPILKVRRIPFNSPLQAAGVAEEILRGALFYAQKKYDSSISCLTRAVETEDKMIYSEPKDWPIPSRQVLGAYLLKLDKPAKAEKVYREDLRWNPGNGWSLLGLCQSLKAQHVQTQVTEYKSKYLESFSHAETIPPASAFIK
jgi:tetratricopeptide (TPR) repeat protein